MADSAAKRPPPGAALAAHAEEAPAELKRIEEERIREEEREMERLEDEQKRREEAEVERERIEVASVRMLTEEAEEEVSGLKRENLDLQRRVCTLQKKHWFVDAEQCVSEDQEAFYRARLDTWMEKKLEFQRVKDQYDTKIDALRGKLQEKQNESNARHEEMIYYFWKIAKDSRGIVSRHGIARHTLFEWVQEERDAITELQVVRIRGRQLKSQLAKLEYNLEMKNHLQLDTGNLHVVDYTQMKIQCQSLNAKIHLKNEALLVLRKKTQRLVHTLTHVREKLQFIVVGCKVDGEALASDDKALLGSRIKLSKIQSSIMSVQRQKESLERNVVCVTSPTALDDMEYEREDIEAEEKSMQAMKKRYQELSVIIEESNKKAYSLGVVLEPTKKKLLPKDTPHNLRWGMRREVRGQTMVGQMAEKSLRL